MLEAQTGGEDTTLARAWVATPIYTARRGNNFSKLSSNYQMIMDGTQT